MGRSLKGGCPSEAVAGFQWFLTVVQLQLSLPLTLTVSAVASPAPTGFVGLTIQLVSVVGTPQHRQGGGSRYTAGRKWPVRPLEA